MNEKFTQVQSGEKLEMDKTESEQVSTATINLLRMFARSYHPKSSLPLEKNASRLN